MNVHNNKPTYTAIKASKGDKVTFINMANDETVQAFRNQHQNTDLLMSICSFDMPELKAQRSYSIYFRIVSSGLETSLKSTREAMYYIPENFSTPEECIDVIYNGGGCVSIGSNDTDSDNHHEDSLIGGWNRRDSGKNATDGSAAEMTVIIPPVVFGGRPLPLMQALNYQLARQLIEDRIENIDIDVYQKDYFIRLPNSINSTTGRHIIPLSIKELLYMDAPAIAELATKPKAEDSTIIPQEVPEAVEWFNEAYKEEENRQQKHKKLQELILKQGWQIPECIRRLLWAELGQENGLEACRITSQLYSALNASVHEIWHQVSAWARRNAYKDYQKLKAIITFAMEKKPLLCDCQHPLLQRFCPAGKCFMVELIEEYEKPYLFKKA